MTRNIRPIFLKSVLIVLLLMCSVGTWACDNCSSKSLALSELALPSSSAIRCRLLLSNWLPTR